MAKLDPKPTTAVQVSTESHPGAVMSPTPDTEAAARQLRERHHHRVAERAYFLAEARGFAPGHELDDWLAAERMEDALDRPT
jgi:hypothetical protein